ncbi:hypothetical protein [uncultured Microscilla sp.]|uniref:hypothetical protein n=1 Tax=uncultured Microscilla sp. TaxID=432653 RepID=UPI00262D3612|nr:hypothetical protein [uncultured Microscilla sp.]
MKQIIKQMIGLCLLLAVASVVQGQHIGDKQNSGNVWGFYKNSGLATQSVGTLHLAGKRGGNDGNSGSFYFYRSVKDNEQFDDENRIMMKLYGDSNRGRLIIGYNTPTLGYELSVDGKVYIKDDLSIDVSTFPDYVFAPSYRLMPLDKLGNYLKRHHHLPKMPTATKVIKKGMAVQQISLLLVEKVEELTLYTLQQQQQLQALRQRLAALKQILKK